MVNLETSAQEVCWYGDKITAFFFANPKCEVADLCKSMMVNVCPQIFSMNEGHLLSQ